MMRDAEKTIGSLIDKQSVAFISSVDENGFPNAKAMLPPRKRGRYYSNFNSESFPIA